MESDGKQNKNAEHLVRFVEAFDRGDSEEMLLVDDWQIELEAIPEATLSEQDRQRLEWLNLLTAQNRELSPQEIVERYAHLSFDEVLERGIVRSLSWMTQLAVEEVGALRLIRDGERTPEQEQMLQWKESLLRTAAEHFDEWEVLSYREVDRLLKQEFLIRTALGIAAEQSLDGYFLARRTPEDLRTDQQQEMLRRVDEARRVHAQADPTPK